jgi:CRP/FNR family transcriptional regulator
MSIALATSPPVRAARPCGEAAAADFLTTLRLIGTRRRVRRGDALYRAGSAFHAIFLVETGFFRTALLTEAGREQVIGFHMRGEVLGFDGIGGGRHACSAVALEDSVISEIPFVRLQRSIREVPDRQRLLLGRMGEAIARAQAVMLLLGSLRAEERLASFLLDLSGRFAAQGGSPLRFRLWMTRGEIGSYLGLKLETVSRSLSRLEAQGVIVIAQRQVEIVDLDGLQRVAQGLHPCIVASGER